jgi:hypothetical protein
VRIARMRHGQGSYLFPNGTAYIGKWREDLPHGTGKLFTKQCTFTGEFHRGKQGREKEEGERCADKCDGEICTCCFVASSKLRARRMLDAGRALNR